MDIDKLTQKFCENAQTLRIANITLKEKKEKGKKRKEKKRKLGILHKPGIKWYIYITNINILENIKNIEL